MDTRPKTIFCDIDGTLVKHAPPHIASKPDHKMELLEGTLERLLEWDKKGYNIILTTGRKESLRAVTEKQLSEVGIFYDQLVMGIGGGTRYLINDCKPDGAVTVWAINIERDKGLTGSNIDLI
jgi:ribonucleotide monophosphatase NagD (HAD superfamily)